MKRRWLMVSALLVLAAWAGVGCWRAAGLLSPSSPPVLRMPLTLMLTTAGP